MRLSICVPTLNRSARVVPLVRYLTQNLKRYSVDEVEIIVADNHSTDATWERLSEIPNSPQFNRIRRESFVETAEEHFIQLIEQSRGEFVWVLGDDDLPNLRTIDTLLRFIREDAADIYVFNHREITDDGTLLTESMLAMNRPWVDIKGRSLIHAAGFISTLSMFSNVVMRRSAVSTAVGREILACSPIYSHVAWYVASFYDMRARVVAAPLVNHRADFRSIQTYFEQYNRLNKQPKYKIWTSGLIALFVYLLERKYVEAEDIARIYEHEFDGRRYRLIDKIVHYIFLQIEAMATEVRKQNQGSWNTWTESELEYLIDAILLVDPGLQDQMFSLRTMYDMALIRRGRRVLDYKRARKKFTKLHAMQIQWRMYEPNFVGTFNEYVVFKVLCGYVAISRNNHFYEKNRERVLNYLDPAEEGDLVLVDESADTLIQRTQECHRTGARCMSEGTYEYGREIRQLIESAYFATTPLRWFGKVAVRARVVAWRLGGRAKRRIRRVLAGGGSG